MSDRLHEGGVLVDTCMWIEFFRESTAATQVLADLIQAGRAFVAGVVIYELMQGVRTERERSMIRGVLAGLGYVEMSSDLWETAGVLAKTLKRKGQTLPMSDILLAALAVKHKLAVFSIDRHFENIPELRRYLPGKAG